MIGEHIRALKGGRWIHAVDCGDETVLHLVDEAPPARVRRAYRPEFVAGAVAVETVTHRERTFPSGEIVRRAYSRASDPALAAMFRDSEAFAEWCATGRLPGPRSVAPDVPGAAPAPAPPAAAPPASGPKEVAPAPARPARRAKGAGARTGAKARSTSSPKPRKAAKAKAGAAARSKKPDRAPRRPAKRARRGRR
jgi:hypothetical protein